VKLYTAEWRDDSKGWRLDSDDAFKFLEKCSELGIENINAHKGPTIRPLNRDAFDVKDIDDAASSFPELNFIVNHVGLPRLDDFCWIAAQEPNVYGGLAVASAMSTHRERKFGEIMGELFWLGGEDRVLFGSDYALWNPDWLVEQVINAELTDEQKDEYRRRARRRYDEEDHGRERRGAVRHRYRGEKSGSSATTTSRNGSTSSPTTAAMRGQGGLMSGSSADPTSDPGGDPVGTAEAIRAGRRRSGTDWTASRTRSSPALSSNSTISTRSRSTAAASRSGSRSRRRGVRRHSRG